MFQKISKLLEPENPDTIMTQAYVIVAILFTILIGRGIYEALYDVLRL